MDLQEFKEALDILDYNIEQNKIYGGEYEITISTALMLKMRQQQNAFTSYYIDETPDGVGYWYDGHRLKVKPGQMLPVVFTLIREEKNMSKAANCRYELSIVLENTGFASTKRIVTFDVSKMDVTIGTRQRYTTDGFVSSYESGESVVIFTLSGVDSWDTIPYTEEPVKIEVKDLEDNFSASGFGVICACSDFSKPNPVLVVLFTKSLSDNGGKL